VVQYIGKKNNIERLGPERDAGAVEHVDGNVGMGARQDVNAPDAEIGTFGLQNRGDQTVTATNVEHTGSGGKKLREPGRQSFNSAGEYQLLVQNTDSAHEC
jgi:hypothetical protein